MVAPAKTLGLRWRTVVMLCSLSVGSFVASPASAGEVEVTPMAGFRFDADFGSAVDDGSLDLELDESGVHGLTVDVSFDGEGWLELWYSRQSTRVEEDSGLLAPNGRAVKIDIDHLHFGGIYQYTESPELAAFFSFTVGATRLDPPSGFDSETRFSASIGTGIKWKPLRRIGLRLHGRWIPTLVESDGEVLCGENDCLVVIDGSWIHQFELAAGIIVRFGPDSTQPEY